MTEFDLVAPSDISEVEPWLSSQGFTVKSMGTSIPGGHHWHIGRAGTPGTLELTWDPYINRLWLSRRENREADWIDEAFDLITTRFGPAFADPGEL